MPHSPIYTSPFPMLTCFVSYIHYIVTNGSVNVTYLTHHYVASEIFKRLWVFYREAVVAVDRHLGKETEEFLPQKRSRLYGITTTATQCPQGMTSISQSGD